MLKGRSSRVVLTALVTEQNLDWPWEPFVLGTRAEVNLWATAVRLPAPSSLARSGADGRLRP